MQATILLIQTKYDKITLGCDLLYVVFLLVKKLFALSENVILSSGALGKNKF